MIKLAIHFRENSFSERWVNFCKENEINYKIVNCYDSDIIVQLKDCDGLMWHHSHSNYKDALFAKGLLFSLQQAGIKVFPDFNTAWHFDDKVGQKYLLESISAPFIPSYVFYDKKTALNWAKKVSFPKVFKLRGGAGSRNVKLVNNVKHCRHLIKKAFTSGFSTFNALDNFKEQVVQYKRTKEIKYLLKGIFRLFFIPGSLKLKTKERGYIYFQDFIPNNDHDIRVIVVEDKAFAIKRMTRENDFRASGSGVMKYAPSEIPIDCIKIAFDVNDHLKSQCIGFDFVYDENNQPLVIEIGYGFTVKGYDSCPGYWTSDLQWHEGPFNPQEWMIKNFILEIERLKEVSFE